MDLAQQMEKRLGTIKRENWEKKGYSKPPENRKAYLKCLTFIEQAVEEGKGSCYLLLSTRLEEHESEVGDFNYESLEVKRLLEDNGGFKVEKVREDECTGVVYEVSWTNNPEYGTQTKVKVVRVR